jgi:hypothetical protein
MSRFENYSKTCSDGPYKMWSDLWYYMFKFYYRPNINGLRQKHVNYYNNQK